MSLILKCDTCPAKAPKPRGLPPGWRISANYQVRKGRSVFLGMKHACPSCPMDLEKPPEFADLPVLTEEQAEIELEEAARFALNEKELSGPYRSMLERALAMLDAARKRTGG